MISHWLKAILFIFALFVSINSANANLVVNGGFEDSPDGFGWVITNAPQAGICVLGGCESPNTGSKAAYLNGGDGKISQSVFTDIGTTYLVEFYLADNLDSSSPHLDPAQVSFGDTIGLNYDHTDVPFATTSGYTYFSFTHVATAINTEFIWEGTGNFFHTQFLDDVSITAISSVPVPAAIWLFISAIFSLSVLRSLRK